ncbi:hypothetical protein [uncultured Methylibium sp.]|uniref:hypothetical protein n=1 Tax=uncultured Methylibium sp. TaxID=381093 RepID=UPI0025F519BF|nr:hypothetical protein [uncultured Methylibium sp.]
MVTTTVNLPAARIVSPRAAEPLGIWAAAFLRWISLRLNRQPRPSEPQKEIAELWALANQYESTQPSLAADLRGAAMRWERETERA